MPLTVFMFIAMPIIFLAVRLLGAACKPGTNVRRKRKGKPVVPAASEATASAVIAPTPLIYPADMPPEIQAAHERTRTRMLALRRRDPLRPVAPGNA